MFQNASPPTIIAVASALAASAYFIMRRSRSQRAFERSPFAKLRNYRAHPMTPFACIILLGLAVLLCGLAVLRPQWGVRHGQSTASGIDVVFTLDVSKSMKAQDLGAGKGGQDRLGFAKSLIRDFVEAHPENRYGLVVFAGDAFVSAPLTMDHAAFLTFLDGTSDKDVANQGTDLSQAVKTAIARFEAVPTDKTERGRAIVLLSDGGDEMMSETGKFADAAKKVGVMVFTVGLGSAQGAKIPAGQDPWGNVSYETYQGKELVVKLNEKPLKDLASWTGGTYYRAENGKDLEKISQELKKLQTTVLEYGTGSMPEDRYQWFLGVALVCFLGLLALTINPTLPSRLSTFDFRLSTTCLALLFCILTLPGCAVNDAASRYHNTQGNRAFDKRYLPEARDEYLRAASSSANLAPVAEHNLGLTAYEQGDVAKARDIFAKIAETSCANPTEATTTCGSVFYNLGNAHYRVGETEGSVDAKKKDWQNAIEAYTEDLKRNPNDTDAQENIAFILGKMKDAEAQAQQQQQSQSQNASSTQDGSASSTQGGQEGSRTGDPLGRPSQSENQGSGTAQDKQLDAATNEQINQYLQQMSNQEKQLQPYFNQNPDANPGSNDPFQDMFSDPFFNQMFGQQFNGQFAKPKDPNAKDW